MYQWTSSVCIVRIAQNNTPAIATVGFIAVVISYYLTKCFSPHGPSSGEYNILIRPFTSYVYVTQQDAPYRDKKMCVVAWYPDNM
jgi:hypothetical protein